MHTQTGHHGIIQEHTQADNSKRADALPLQFIHNTLDNLLDVKCKFMLRPTVQQCKLALWK